MIRLIFLVIGLLMGVFTVWADNAPEDDQGFISLLDETKNPFVDGLPKPVHVAPVVTHVYTPPKPRPAPPPLPPPPPPPVRLPSGINVQGVMVGPNMHEAIINGQAVDLGGYVKGAAVIEITQHGVTFKYKGKKFLLPVD
jgi:hypothetical protein